MHRLNANGRRTGDRRQSEAVQQNDRQHRGRTRQYGKDIDYFYFYFIDLLKFS